MQFYLAPMEGLTGYVSQHEDLTQAIEELTTALSDLDTDPSVLEALRHRELVEAGLPLVIDATCPLCDLPWPDADSLRSHLAGKLVRSENAARFQQRTRC